MTKVQLIDDHLNFERNKNVYLIQKNESLRSANQHFAKSYEALKLKVNEMAQERAAWYEKNVSLHFEKNRLKRSLLSYKEMLCKTSSKNKGLLLNLKSAFDDLMRDTTFLDEFITSLPHDIDTGGFEDEAECDTRFMFKSPQCKSFPSFKPVLSPIPEENLDVTIKSSSSSRSSISRSSINRSRLGRRASKKPDNITDKIKNLPPDDNASSKENEDLHGHSVWTAADLKDKEASGVQDGAGHSTIKLANLGDHDICNSDAETGSGRLESAITHTTELGLVERDDKLFTFTATHNVNKSKSEDTAVSEQKGDKTTEGTVCLQSFASPFATLKRKKNFFSPLPDKENYTMPKTFESCAPITPVIACKSASKRSDNLKISRWDLGKLSILMNSIDSGLDINTKCEEEGPQDGKLRHSDRNALNSSMQRKKPASTGNKRKMNRSIAGKYKLETSGKKRKSVFEVYEKNVDDVKGEDVGGHNYRFCFDDQNEMMREEGKSDEFLVSDELVTVDKETPKLKVRNRQRKTPVKATKVKATPSRKNEPKADDPEITNKIQTRARSKKAEDNGKTRYAEKSNKSGSEGKRTTSKSKKPQNGAKVVVTRNKGKKIPSGKSEEAVDRKRPSTTASPEGVKLSARESSSAVKCLTRSTPKLITGSLDTTDLNEISLSPIKKNIQDNNKENVRTTTAKQCKLKTGIDVQRFEKDANSNKQENKDVLSQKKYVVFSDLLKATANLKVATQDDIFQMKKFLINIGCGAKKVDRKSAADIKPPDQELPKEDPFTSISDKEINSLLSTISSPLATVIRNLEIKDEGH